MFLICTGALQAIPGEMTEAARVDGASGLQVFRKITLPLLLVAVAPLLIASFAFNFNNFNAIYFLTEGGPYSEDQSVAGSTDILVSYTYKVAFQTGPRRRLRPRGRALDRDLPDHRHDLGDHVHPDQGPGERRVTTGARAGPDASAAERAVAAALETAAGRRGRDAEAGAAAVPRGLVALPRRAARDGVRPLPGRLRRLGRVQPGAVALHRVGRPGGRHARQLPRDPVRPEGALPQLVPQHDDHRDRDRGRDRPPGRARRVRVLALPLQGTPLGDALAAPDPDVPAVPRGRRDLPDHARHLRRLPGDRAQHPDRA